MYEISYRDFDGDLGSLLNGNYSVVETNQVDEFLKATIRIEKQTGPNELIFQLLPHMEIHSINEILPTMNDIFISSVEKNKKP